MQLCRLDPPGTKPSALASYSPWINPMNSIIKRRDRSEKVARIRQPVRANRPQIWQTKQRTVVLADITTRFFLQKFDAETNSPLNHRNLAGTGFENTHLRTQQQPSHLRHDQHLSIGVVEKTIRHRGVGDVDVNP